MFGNLNLIITRGSSPLLNVSAKVKNNINFTSSYHQYYPNIP